MKRVVITFFLTYSIFGGTCLFSQNPSFVWAKKIAGQGATENVYSSVVDAFDNIYITGSYSGTVDFDPGARVYNLTSVDSLDLFFAKYDASGNLIWAKSIGGMHNEESNSIFVDGLG